MRLQATRTSITSAGGAVDALYRAAGSRPTLDQRFAKDKSLVDKVSGQNLITFTRASSATYVGSDGLIKTSQCNLLKESQVLNDSTWVKYGSVVVANTTTAPDGTLTAEKLREDGGNSFHRIRQSITAETTGNFSIYVKADERDKFEIGTSDTAVIAVFDLSSESVTSGTGTIESEGNGWYRCSVNGTFTTNGPYFLLRNNTSEFYQGDNSSGLYVWGAQLEKGTTTPSEYVKTESVINGAPRFDHDPVTGKSLGLLLEEARTNLLLNSSGDSDLTYWGRSNASRSVVDGPDGTNSAYQYLSTGGTVATKVQSNNVNAVSTVVGEQYVLSCYVKGVNYDVVSFGGSVSGFTGNTRCRFELSTGTVQVQPSATESARVIPAGNGWYRLEVVTEAATSVGDLVLFLDLGTASTEPQTTDEGFQVYGLQIEEGTFASSYIPTTDAQATRAPDDVRIGTTNVSSWYNQGEGAFVTTTSAVTNLQTTAARAVWYVYQNGLAGATFRHYVLYRANSADQYYIASKYAGSDAFAPINAGDPTYTDDVVAYGYSSTELSDVYASGSQISSSTGIQDWTIYTADRVVIGGSSTNKLNGHVSRFSYFSTKRSDQELINVTGGSLYNKALTYGITSAGGTFNLLSTGTVDYAVDWDSTGGYETSTANSLAHTYAAGDYELVLYSNVVYRPYFNSTTSDVQQITSVVISADAALGTTLEEAWYGASNMTSFECPFDVTSNVNNFTHAWQKCSSLTSFPLIDTSSGTNFEIAWRDCTSLTSFPLIDTSSGTNFKQAWRNCSSLTSFPLIDTSSGTNFRFAWTDCTNLADFPANMFDTTGTLMSNAFNAGFDNCALTAQSIENILVSLDTNGASNNLIEVDGGTNAAKTTWSTAANTAYTNLINKGWTISFNA